MPLKLKKKNENKNVHFFLQFAFIKDFCMWFAFAKNPISNEIVKIIMMFVYFTSTSSTSILA